jgi:hypothetical protein
MKFSFKTFIEAYSHEISMMRKLRDMDMHTQATKDQEIHQRAIAKGNFGDTGNKLLSDDMYVKQKFKELLNKSKNGDKIDAREKQDLITLLHKDQEGHRGYLARQDFNPTTGSAEWHQMWIDIYDRWLTWLDQH